MLRSLLTVLSTISLILFFGGNGSAEITTVDTFDGSSLGFNKTEDEFNYYDILGMAGPGSTPVVRVRNVLLATGPSINETGPLGEHSWVLSTGSSTKFRDVHWQHMVDIRYNFDQLMGRAAISFKYLNTRACGGRVDLIFVQYAGDGSLLWYQNTRLENWENWPGPYVSRIPGTIGDRTWRSYSFTAEQAVALTQGKPFNCVIIREFDITSETGSGFFEDVEIIVDPADIHIEAPTLISIGSTDDNQPLLDWEVVNNSLFYEIAYGSNADMTGANVVSVIGPSEYSMPTPLADGTWYWRVRAMDDYGNVGSWSSIGVFTIDTSQNCETIISQPTLLSPADNSADVSMEPTLTTLDFSDGGNCSGHWKTHWKIHDRADDFDGATTFNYVSMDHSVRETGNSKQKKGSLTSLEIPSMVLEPGTTYFWKVRYHGDRGNKSEWSEVYSFTTENDSEDQDGDGLPDDAEVDDDTDLNHDNIPDKDQVGVMTSVKVKNGKKKIGIESNACVISRVCVMDEQEIDDDNNKPDQMPYGLIGYKFEPPHYGETVSIKIHLSEPAPVGAKWVFYDKLSGWQDYSGYASFNQARDEITLELKDGGFGDEDHTENKCIIDPGGLGIYAGESATSSSSGSGGCFINTMLK